MKKIICLLFAIVTIASGCNNEPKRIEVNILAAASMQNSLSEIELQYEKDNPDVDLVFSYGGSGTLVTQINEGAPADIFISASTYNFKQLENKQSILEQKQLVSNSLVVITNDNFDPNNWDEVNTIAIGTPTAVPAGTYAKQALVASGYWEQISDQLVQAKDVSQVLSYVQTGNADIGFVYKTDALLADDVKVVLEVDESLYDPIKYPIGLLTNSTQAYDFYQYLSTKEASQIFQKYGFITND